MTTIATDGNTMAADGRVTEGSEICRDDYRKVRRLKDGRIVGFSGNSYHDDAFATWLENGSKGDVPKGMDAEFCCLVLTPGGDIFTYDQHGRCFCEKPPYAIGSGRKYARSAMELGKTPIEAVSFACRFDIYSGGEIIALWRNVLEQVKAA